MGSWKNRLVGFGMLLASACSGRSPAITGQNWFEPRADAVGKYSAAQIGFARDGMLSVLLQDGNTITFVHCKDARCDDLTATRLSDIRQESQSATAVINDSPQPVIVLSDRRTHTLTFLRCEDDACRSHRITEAQPFHDHIEDVESSQDQLIILGARLSPHGSETEFRRFTCEDARCAEGTAQKAPAELSAGPFAAVLSGGTPWVAFGPAIYSCEGTTCLRVPMDAASPDDSVTGIAATATLDGTVWFAFRSRASDTIRLVRCAGSGCRAAATIQAETPDFIGLSADQNNIPLVTFTSGKDRAVHLARCDDSHCRTVRLPALGRALPSAAVPATDGTLWIAYSVPGDDGVKLAHCMDRDCSSVSTVILPRYTARP